MASNKALVLLKTLKKHKMEGSLSDPIIRRMSGLNRCEIDAAAEELEDQGFLEIEKTYTVAEDFR